MEGAWIFPIAAGAGNEELKGDWGHLCFIELHSPLRKSYYSAIHGEKGNEPVGLMHYADFHELLDDHGFEFKSPSCTV